MNPNSTILEERIREGIPVGYMAKDNDMLSDSKPAQEMHNDVCPKTLCKNTASLTL